MGLFKGKFNNTFVRSLIVAVLMVSLLWAAPMEMESVPVVYAATEGESFVECVGEEIMPLTEQFEWRYRVHNGRLQRRLWSLTWGVWRTDWEYV
ncbi:MAG: hypothetical protein FWD00_03430 [Clostridiales bacterium]|nr:hypothetical protein [Clostridiales bacterium]